MAHIVTAAGRQRPVTLSQEWPVRRPLPERLIRRGLCERRYPVEPLSTTIRLIDTFFPIALGGTACIPGSVRGREDGAPGLDRTLDR